MRTREIASLLNGYKLWEHCTPPCRAAFIQQMRGRQYGWDALHDAFNWFVEGWIQADIARLVDTCSQINTDSHVMQEEY